MTVIIGTTYAEEILDLSANATLWGALFSAMPTLIDPLSSEVAGGGYARPSAVMSRSGRRLINNNTWIFPGVPAGQIVAVGLFTAATNGDLWLATPCPAITTPGDRSLILEPGEVAFSI